MQASVPSLNTGRWLIHFDYDAFYASVVEHEDPALKAVPLIIQQKQIVCTCNYKARERGVYKLQLMTDAVRICPEAVVILGEDLTRFRDASKALYGFLRERIWSDRAERLGFDEVWLDCTDMIDYNAKLLSQNDLTNSFFCMDRDDPTIGFAFDAMTLFGQTEPAMAGESVVMDDDRLRLHLASHLARHLRHELESQVGYTATVGIGPNKVLSKLVGNVNKPHNQTTMIPPYEPLGTPTSNVTQFIDAHDIGKIPGVGFKLAQKIRSKVLGRTAVINEGLVMVNASTKESVSVGDVRTYPGMGPEMLEEILGGPGAPKGIGGTVWGLLHGVDNTEVKKARRVPATISQEDSYMKYLHNFDQVRKQLLLLSERLINRMRVDLTEDDEDDASTKRWMAHPKTLRLSTRPRPPRDADGVRPRTFHRISKSTPLPNFVFKLEEQISGLAEKLVNEVLTSLFRKMHVESSQGWNISLINIAVTNMAESAADTKDSEGRDIGRMFRRQDDVLKDFRVVEESEAGNTDDSVAVHPDGGASGWQSDDDDEESEPYACPDCQAHIPSFAWAAHQQFHIMAAT
jgi:DNA polymerase iota